MVTLSNSQGTAEYVPEDTQLTINMGGVKLSGWLAVETSNGSLPASKSATTAKIEDGVRVLYDDWCNTTVDLRLSEAGVDISVALRNTSDKPITVGDIKPFVIEETNAFTSGTRLYENGYRSSTPTGTLPAGTSFDEEHPRTKPLITDTEAPDDARTSHYLTAVQSDDEHLTLGFLDYETYITRFDAYTTDDDGIERLEAVCPADGITLSPGKTLESAPLRIDPIRPAPEALEAIAEAVGERMDARISEEPTTGWCSWYAYYQEVTQQDVIDNVEAIESADLPLEVIQLDDGYQESWGDWLSVNDKFDDMETLREQIEAHGHTPGIWLAPFLVFGDSKLAAEHPEWLVDSEDSLTQWAVAENDETRRYALDTTHPEAQAWLRNVFDTVVNEWGYDFLKLDFTFTAAMPGDRYADVTRAEAYRQGYEIIREVSGDDVTILSVDLVGTTVGLADAMRVGQDARHWWKTPPDGVMLGEHSGGGTKNGLRNTLNRQFMHRNWWITDPDHQLFGVSSQAGGTGQDQRTAAEKRSFAAVVALSGGVNLVSDEIAQLNDSDYALLEQTLPPIDGGRVAGLAETRFPDRLVTERDGDEAVTVAAFNWEDDPKMVEIDPANYGFETAIVWDNWAETAFVTDDPIEQEIPAHDCLLVLLQQSRPHPQVLGSPDHLPNGASQITDVKWDESARTLAIEYTGTDAMRIAVTEPGGWISEGKSTQVEDIETITLTAGTNRLTFRHEDR